MVADRVTTSGLGHAVGKPEELGRVPAGIREADEAKRPRDLVVVVSPVREPRAVAAVAASPAVLVL